MTTQHRFDFLTQNFKCLSLSLLVLLAGCNTHEDKVVSAKNEQQTTGTPTKKPNSLVILTDQERHHVQWPEKTF